MDNVADTSLLGKVMEALEAEKAQLEAELMTDLEDSEREVAENRLKEICKDLELHKGSETQSVADEEIPPTAEVEVRRSERDRRLTVKMFELKKDAIMNKERQFMASYLQFKADIQLIRSKLKSECSESELNDMIKRVEISEEGVDQDYLALRLLTTPSQDLRRKMDSCTSVSKEILSLLKRRHANIDKEFDAEAVRKSLYQLLQREDARSIYGSTVSRAENSQHNSLTEQRSNASAKRAEAAARLAKKQAEIHREREISAQRQEILAQQEKLKLLETQRDLEAIEAEYCVYAEEELKVNTEIRESEARATLSQFPNQQRSVPCPPRVLQNSGPLTFPDLKGNSTQRVSFPQSIDRQVVPKDSEIALVQALKESLTMTRLPAPEPFVFSGDPLKYIEWSTSFKALIEASCVDPAQRLYYLKRYISGEALSVLDGTFYRSDEEAYVQAWEVLTKRYGHPFVVQRAFRRKLSNWQKIGSKESLKLREFSDCLISCKHAMPHVQGLKVLDDCEENQKILLKLPDWTTTRWNRHVTKLLDEGQDYPGFAEFADFVAEEARIACNPVSSLFALRTFDKSDKEQRRLKSSTLTTTATTTKDTKSVQGNKGFRPNPSATQSARQIECICCRQNHFIYKCHKFAEMSLDARKRFVIDNNMCFSCLRVGHFSKNCRQKASCNICRKKHPTPLHEDRPQGEKSETPPPEENALAVSNNVQVHCSDRTPMIVPVWLSCSEGNGREILVYTLLDTQSSNTFIAQDFCVKIQAPTELVKLKLTTMTDRGSIEESHRVNGLRVRGYYSQQYIQLPPTYTREYIPLERESIPTCETAKKWKHLENIADWMPELLDCPAALLIGYDCARALKPREVISGNDYDPYAVKTDLGWSIVGSNKHWTEPSNVSGACYRVSVKELPSVTPSSVIKALEADFKNTHSKECNISQEDIQFLQTLQSNIRVNEQGHLEMSLPFRERPHLPDSRPLAVTRLKHLKAKMERNPQYKEDYVRFMNSVFEDGDAEAAVNIPADGSTWYIPHHGVYHPRKPQKIRVLFDCSARFKNTSLNDHLLTGPDLINGLLGILCRFREHQVAITCDIERMFHRFHVTPEDRDFLRFLWWQNGDTNAEPKEFRMRVHIFGAASSPGCANYAMKYLASKHSKDYPLAASFIQKNFYMDDGLISLDSVHAAQELVIQARNICAKAKLRLHKFVCNKGEVLNVLPKSEHAVNREDVSLNYSDTPTQSILGVKWNVEADILSFNVILKEKPATRRGILSSVASVYDPLGFLAPYILIGKQVLQEMCRSGVGWDDPIPPSLETKWKMWLDDLENLPKIQIPRCFIPEDIGTLQKIELHHFSDASSSGYGQCSYVRIVAEDKIHCALVLGKARVASTRIVTIPRLELTAAAVSAEISNFLKAELELKVDKDFFWTDSRVVLGYIKNDARRFHVFVANRVQRIRDFTDPNQWFYVDTHQNPADHASRGLKVAELLDTNWLKGPSFLYERELDTQTHTPELLIGDPEVRVLSTTASETEHFLDRFSRFSNWNTAVNVVARIKRLTKKDRSKPISVEERQAASLSLIRVAQKEAFDQEMRQLSLKANKLPKTHNLYQLDPFVENDVLRVGGRLRKSSASFDLRHPIILPKGGIITRLILDHYHKKIQHQGRGQTMNAIRAGGYWIVSASKSVASHIKGCAVCKRMRGPTEEQRMADLPADRVEPSPPFTYTGLDCFGPFHTKQGRKEFKRYGLIFTCLSSRAIHIEMLQDLSTDAFICGLRCFIAIRGAVRHIRSDQGTNFVGAKNEFEKGLQELDKDRIATFLANNQCDFQMNIPEASHRGGVWERQIRSVRNVLSSVLSQATGRLDDSSLRTFFYEAMSIINNRPLTTNTINDTKSTEPLTPNHLLTMKEAVPLPPPGVFLKADVYARKRWRRIQYLSEQFWHRWHKEYLTNISLRQQWHTAKRNVQVGDIVILKEENLPRNEWKLARVVEANKDDDGLVRKVKIQIGQRDLGKKGERVKQPSILDRPVQKLVLLVQND